MHMEYEMLHMRFSLWIMESIYMWFILNICWRNSIKQAVISCIFNISTSEKQNTLIWGYFIPTFSNKILILNHCRMSKPIWILICHMVDLNAPRKKIGDLSYFDSWGKKCKISKISKIFSIFSILDWNISCKDGENYEIVRYIWKQLPSMNSILEYTKYYSYINTQKITSKQGSKIPSNEGIFCADYH